MSRSQGAPGYPNVRPNNLDSRAIPPAGGQARPEPSYQFTSYDRKMISMFEVLVAYFVGVFFNDIYTIAQSSLSKKSDGKSLTDMYTAQIQAFIIGAKNDEVCYRDLITNLHKYFATYYTTVSFPQFVDRVTSQVIPDEYFSQLSNTERDEVLSSTICDLTSGLAAFVTKPEMLHRIIDNHGYQWQVTQRMIQDHGVTILLAKRETLHNQFLHKIGQANDHVPIGLIDELKKVLRRSVKEKIVERARAAKLADEVRHLREREAKYLKLIALLRNGGTTGATAALQEHLMPRQDRLAEVRDDDDPLDHRSDRGRHSSRIPDEDTLAEDRHESSRKKHHHSHRSRPSSDSESDDSQDQSDETDDGSASDDDHHSRRRHRDRDRDHRDRHDRRGDDHKSRHSRRRDDRDRDDRSDRSYAQQTPISSAIVVTAGPTTSPQKLEREVGVAISAATGASSNGTGLQNNTADDSVDLDDHNRDGDSDGEPVNLTLAARRRK